MSSNEKSYKYLIIGGGMASQAAIQGIRKNDTSSVIGVLNQEESSHYKRPWLSKKLWDNESIDNIWMDVPNHNLEILNNNKVQEIIPNDKKVLSDKGASYFYDKLLIASGGSPKKLSFMPEDDNVIYFRNLNDYKELKKKIETGKKVGVIGGSFIGSEIAAALNQNKCDVTMIFPEKGICSNIFSNNLSEYLNEYFIQKGVEIINEDPLIDCDKNDKNRFILHTRNGKQVEVDIVVIGIGIEPNTTFLQKSNLEIEDGLKVNHYLQTSDTNIYAAGDVALYYYPSLEKSIRFEHEDNALIMGHVAGQNMTEKEKIEYNHLPYFYSDLFDLGYEAVGECNNEFDIVEKWDEKFKKGRIFYSKNNIIKGIILWNRWDEVNDARKMITNKERIEEYQKV